MRGAPSFFKSSAVCVFFRFAVFGTRHFFVVWRAVGAGRFFAMRRAVGAGRFFAMRRAIGPMEMSAVRLSAPRAGCGASFGRRFAPSLLQAGEVLFIEAHATAHILGGRFPLRRNAAAALFLRRNIALCSVRFGAGRIRCKEYGACGRGRAEGGVRASGKGKGIQKHCRGGEAEGCRRQYQGTFDHIRSMRIKVAFIPAQTLAFSAPCGYNDKRI